MPAPEKINIRKKFELVTDYWHPRIVGELNGQHVKIVKMSGEFPWHHHEDEDELFLVTKGSIRLEFRESAVTLGEGEFIIVPKGTEHRPVAEEEAEVMLFEPASTLNTGNAGGPMTRSNLEKI